MAFIRSICRKCGRDRYIVNRTHGLCEHCNKLRLEKNSLKSPKPVKNLIASKLVKKASEIKLDKKKETYKVMDDTLEHICGGCGRTQRLSHSHIIPISKRKDLEADINNIGYDCLSFGDDLGCHDIWEHGTMLEKQKLLDFEKRMVYIKSVDSVYYNQLMVKLEQEEKEINTSV